MKQQMLNDLYDKIKLCRCDCPGEREGAGLAMDNGGLQSGIVLLGEAPGGEEIKNHTPFVGQAGQKLDGYLKLAGINRNDIFITNTVKCRPTKNNGHANRRPSGCEVKSCAVWLDDELDIIAPAIVITLGDVALRKLSGNTMRIGDWHARPFNSGCFSVFPLYHPAASIYRRALEEIIKEDFEKLGHWLKQQG